MAVKIGNGTTQFVAITGDETFILDAGKTRDVTGAEAINGFDAPGDGVGGRLYKLNGTINSDFDAVNVFNNDDADRDTVKVGKTGLVTSATDGMDLNGGEIRLVNAGRIEGEESGVRLGLEHAVVVNSGTISGVGQAFSSVGIRLGFETVSLVNGGLIEGPSIAVLSIGSYTIENSGRIDGGTTGIQVDTGGTLVNSGFIRGGDDAILAQGGGLDGRVHEIVNRGTLFGDIDLSTSSTDDVITLNGGFVRGAIDAGDGDDRIVIRNGAKVTGDVDGGGDDDTFIIDNKDVSFGESLSGGTDTIRSSVGFSLLNAFTIENLTLTGNADINAGGSFGDNVLTGNAGDNALSGLKGADTLDGGKGRDLLTLGQGADTIIFATGDGKDTIADFTAEDFVDLSGLAAIADFTDLVDNHLDEIDGDLVIKAGSDRIRLLGLTIEDLAEGQVLF